MRCEHQLISFGKKVNFYQPDVVSVCRGILKEKSTFNSEKLNTEFKLVCRVFSQALNWLALHQKFSTG